MSHAVLSTACERTAPKAIYSIYLVTEATEGVKIKGYA